MSVNEVIAFLTGFWVGAASFFCIWSYLDTKEKYSNKNKEEVDK